MYEQSKNRKSSSDLQERTAISSKTPVYKYSLCTKKTSKKIFLKQFHHKITSYHPHFL